MHITSYLMNVHLNEKKLLLRDLGINVKKKKIILTNRDNFTVHKADSNCFILIFIKTVH